jgi:lytic starch monooxygenase
MKIQVLEYLFFSDETMKVFVAASMVTATMAHGIFWTPTSRAILSEQSGYEADATTIISEPMPDVTDEDREYPGNRPFAEPGVSISNVGPCGMETYDSLMTNWNHPAHSWGDVQATYNAGDVITVEWCVSDIADHGGVYSYRLCQDDELVAKFIDADYTPNATDMAALETCFQDGILSCSDVEGQDCSSPHPDCVGTGWGCESATSWFACGPKDSGRCMMKSQGYCYTHGADGSILRDQVKLPAGYTSNHTLLGFRWDCEDTGQLWLHCADIQIV